jgi:hypothetical protein
MDMGWSAADKDSGFLSVVLKAAVVLFVTEALPNDLRWMEQHRFAA